MALRGDYQPQARMREGQGAEVWRGHHAALPDREVVLRQLDAVTPELRAAVRGLSELRHPRLVPILTASFDPEGVVVTPFLPGGDLRSRLRAGPLSPEAALPVLEGVAEGLAALHEAGLAHGGLCPENVLFDADGALRLSDAGLGDPSRHLATLAPEQRDGGAASPTADVYAFGILLFEVLTGARPEGAERPSDRDAELPAWVDALFDRCYAPRSRRIADGAALRRALDEEREAPSARPGMVIGGEVSGQESEAIKLSPRSLEPAFTLPEAAPRRRGRSLLAASLTLGAVAAGFSLAWTQGLLTSAGMGAADAISPYDTIEFELRQAREHYLRGEYLEARALLDGAAELESHVAELYELRGQVLTELGEMEAAVADFDRALFLAPRDAAVLRHRADALVYLHSPSKAIEDYKAALALDPSMPDAARIRGLIAELEARREL